MREEEKNTDIDYFVSFSYVMKNGKTGFGNAGFRRNIPIWNGKHIEELQDDILKTNENYRSIIILNWKRFED